MGVRLGISHRADRLISTVARKVDGEL
jgi:hypothetical protein